MSATAFACPGCKTKYPWKDELAGRKLKCQKCGHSFQIKLRKPKPLSATSPAAAAPVAAAVAAGFGPPSDSLGALLDEELNSAVPAKAPSSPSEESAQEPEKRPCPLCENLVEAGRDRCPICKTRMDKPRQDPDAERRKEEAREWMFVLAGLGGALAITPLLFLAIVLVMGKDAAGFALVVCAIEVNYIVAIGCFALACRVFRQEPPEISEILRVVAYATLSSNILFSWFGGSGLGWAAAATGVASIVGAALCMTYLEMPVFPSIFIGFTYNIFSTIFTFIGVFLLGLVFAGYAIGTGQQELLEEFESQEYDSEEFDQDGEEFPDSDESFPEEDFNVRMDGDNDLRPGVICHSGNRQQYGEWQFVGNGRLVSSQQAYAEAKRPAWGSLSA